MTAASTSFHSNGNPRIVVAGAGTIGCYIGGCLVLAGRSVTFLARPWMCGEVRRFGLRLTDYAGSDRRIMPGAVTVSDAPAQLAQAEIVLVTVKSGATIEMAQAIARYAPEGAAVISLQNGVENADLLRAHLPRHRVLAGMVPFNVLHKGDGWFHRGTEGEMIVQAGIPGVAGLLDVPGCACKQDVDMRGILWGKLLLNLNNALNALSGLPLKTQLSDRRWRRVIADSMSEALDVLAAAGIRPRKLAKLPPSLIPWVLRLPDPLFRAVAGAMVKIDPEARSSMWEDLERRRTTEVEQLQGAILRLADSLGRDAPLARRIVALVHAAESRGEGSPHLDADLIRAA